MKVAIIMGSDSDWGVMKSAVDTLKNFSVDVELTVASAHRTPQKVHDFVKKSDAQIFIAAAGMAAHLAGVVASLTTRPVIGVPINSEPFKGLDSLLSTVQMPAEFPWRPWQSTAQKMPHSSPWKFSRSKTIHLPKN